MAASLRCSVVVPVWNPGPNLDRCVDSLLGQSMPRTDYEIVLVDDGSTDGSADRLDSLARLHPDRIKVLHTPPSGWPGRPRNLGVDAARGTYVHFVDNDDVLPAYALKAMCDAGDRDTADVVLGRPASDFRGINHAIYQHDRHGVTLADFPGLVETTTPHKMFRREFLVQHDIRFPEARPREDQPFMMRAYARASSVTVLTDRCYYFYLRRLGSGRNAGDQTVDPAAHFKAIESILDVLDAEVHDRSLRDRLARRFYRVEVLNMLWAPGTLNAPSDVQHRLFDDALRVATSRFNPAVRSGTGAVHRTLGALLESDDVPGTMEFAKECRRIGLRVEAREVHWATGALVCTIDAALTHAGEPVVCDANSRGWALPAELAPGVSIEDRLLDPARDQPDAEVMLVSRNDSVKFGLGAGLRVGVDDSGVVRVAGTVRIDPDTALAGAPLTDGVWDLQLRLWFAGISRSPVIRVQLPQETPIRPLLRPDAGTVRPFLDGKAGQLVLDVGGWLASPASTLASSSDVVVSGPGRLRLSVATETGAAATPISLQLTTVEEELGRGFDCTGALSRSTEGSATAVLRLPAELPDGEWQLWLRLVGAGAAPPVALPWRVCRENREIAVVPSVTAAG